jgi:hypothetical protein
MAYEPHDAADVQLRALQEDNRRLRERLDQIEQQAQASAEARVRLMRGGFRILMPILDRHRVVRSFGSLAETVGDLTGPRDRWPTREQLLADARLFMESVVRFMVRRRIVLWFFSILAAIIPIMQIWLFIQQNRIIENQNEFFQIQVYDVVARSMTEGDRNARLMTGALLARADLGFLEGVVEEAFDPTLAGVYQASGVHAAERRLEDAAFRGHLARALSRAVEHRAHDMDPPELLRRTRPMARRVLADAADRMPEVLRLGRQELDTPGALAEQVDNYIAQVGGLMSVYGRLARSAHEPEVFHADIRPLLARLSGRRAVEDSRFASTYRAVMQDFLFEVATGPGLGDPPVDLAKAGLSPEQALSQGLDALRRALGDDAVRWELLAQQVGAR